MYGMKTARALTLPVVETENLLPYSQQPGTGLHDKPNELTSHLHLLF
jgi:hypothetical protein